MVSLDEKGDLPVNCESVGKGGSPCILCVSFDVISLLEAEKVPFEYLNDTNS